MADRKITDLTALAAGSQATGDLLTIVDVSEGAAADKNKKITVESLFKGIPGNVGVGTASPYSILGGKSVSIHNSGGSAELNFLGSTSGFNAIYFGDGTSGAARNQGYIEYNHSSNYMRFATSALERLRIDSSGNVGIGTSSPNQLLHIQGSGTTRIQITGGSSDTARINLGDTDDEDIGQIIYNNSNDSLQFIANGTERMRIDSSGRVGIGTTSPGYPLEVAGQIETSGSNNAVLFDGASSTPTIGAGIHKPADDTLAFVTASNERARFSGEGRFLLGTTTEGQASADNLTIADSANCGITIRSGTSSQGALFFSDATSGTGEYDGFITYDQGTRVMRLGTATSERMRIDSSGRLSVGTTSADSNTRLHVSAAENTSDPMATDASIVIANTQNAGNNEAAALKFNLGNTNTASISAHYDSFSAGVNSSLRFYTQYQSGFNNPAERMRILPHGSLRVSTARTDSDYAQNNTDYWHAFHHHVNNQAAAIFEHSGDSSPYGIIIDLSDASPDNNTNYFLSCFDQQAERLKIFSDGDVDNHDNSYSGFSDVKLKQDIVDAGSQWDDIKNLRVRKFKFKSDVANYGDEARTLIGVVAQETELVSPGLVKESPDLDKYNNDLGTTTKSVRYSVLYMKAVKALQEAQARIETLESQQADLLARVTALEAG